MKPTPAPATPATRLLTTQKIPFAIRLYSYVDHGGTGHAALELHTDEHRIIKTLVFEDETKTPLIMLMHGDQEVSLKELARALHVKTITPCSPQSAQRHTGYQVGGISPFATRKHMPVYAQSTILQLPNILINAGKRGALLELDPACLRQLLPLTEVHAARP